jgi:hypothetical protein
MLTGLVARFALTDGMRAFLGTFGKPLLIAAAIGIAILIIDRRGYQRAEEQERLHKLERQELTRAIVQAIDGELDQRLAAIAARTSGKIQTIDTEGKTVVQPIITREILRDRTLTDPNRCLSPGLLEAINAARGYLLDERSPAPRLDPQTRQACPAPAASLIRRRRGSPRPTRISRSNTASARRGMRER